MKKALAGLLLALMVGLAAVRGPAAPASAVTPGGIFVTGHDPDYHAYRGGNTTGSKHLLQRAIDYVTFGKASPTVLLVTDLRYPGGDNSDSRLGMTAAGYTYDVADYGSGTPGILDLYAVNFSNYDVVVVASDYGGWLRQDELDILNARAGDLLAYVNAGGGIVALNESGNRSGSPIGTSHDRYGFLPFIVSDLGLNQSEVGNHVTPAGAAMGLTDSDVNGNASHSVFTATGGMDVIDVDSAGRILSLATRGKYIGTGGTCTDYPSVGWNAPLNPNAAYDLSLSMTLPVSFRWGTCTEFLHDESVIVLVVDQANPNYPITAYVYGYDISIDDAHQSYHVTFEPALYGLAPGANLTVQIYIGNALVGSAPVHITP